MKGSNKINVVPPTAELELDCRLVPDQDPQQLLSELVAIIHDDNVEITRIMCITRAVSMTETPLYEAIGSSAIKNMENAVLISSVSTGFTDSHFFVVSPSSAMDSFLFSILKTRQRKCMAIRNAFIQKR